MVACGLDWLERRGSEIVGGDERVVQAKVEALGRERGVRAAIAYDGLDVVLR